MSAAEDDEEEFYQKRKVAYGISTQEEVNASATDESAVWLDVRSEKEIVASKRFVKTDKKWVHAECNDDGDCPLLQMAAENMIHDKDNAKVIVYCSSGRRAYTAKSLLQRKGYKHVVNAGGLVDLATRNKYDK